MNFVRVSPLQLTRVSIYDIIQNSVKKINLPKNIDVKISGVDLEITCDPVKLDAVFLNLLVNAIQALDNDGKIEIKISEKII